MRRQLPFLPSLVTSAVINLAVFSALEPIQPDPAAAATGPKWRVQRLSRVAVARPDESAPALPVAETPPRPEPTRAERAPAERRTRRGRRPGGDGRPKGGGSPRHDLRVAQALPATGGDGTRATPAAPRAGGGDPLTAAPREPGDPRLRQQGPALGGTREPAHGEPDVRDAPPLLVPGAGLRGGTPTAPLLGTDPLAGTAGSGDQPHEIAPRTMAGFDAPLAPTTPGPRLRTKAGPGLPDLPSAPVKIPATVIDAGGRSGGGGGTAALPGNGGGGPPLAGQLPDTARGGGGSGMSRTGPRPGGVELGTGPGGTGGGGNGLAELGNGVEGTADGTGRRPASLGAPSVVTRPGGGENGGAAVRPGKRTPGPGGAPAGMAAEPVMVAGKPGRGGSGGGSGKGRGDGDGDGDGGSATAVGHGSSDGGIYTGVVFDTLALKWHHYPTSFDLRIGSVDGPNLGSFGVVRYPSVPAAKASDRVSRKGKRNVIVIRPIEIEYVVKPGEGARQRVVISASDAELLKSSGLLRDRSRVLTVYKKNYG